MPAPELSGQVRVNVRTAVNNAQIRRDKRNGKDVIIVPSATLPDDVVMNNIKYPADEIAKSFHTLDRTFAPFRHPMVNGQYVSAREPEAVNDFYIGAWNENVRRENGRVWLDKVIDVEVANRTDSGKRLLDAINKGEPIHTSTGIFMEVDPANDAGYSYIAKNMYFDHDAILLDEEGAATPNQGVGMMVNSKQEIPVINSVLDRAVDELEWAAGYLADAVERVQEAEKKQTIIDKILSALGIGKDKSQGESLKANGNSEVIDMPISEERFDALEKSVQALVANAEKFAESLEKTVSDAVKPLQEQVTALTANAAKAEEAERTELTAKVVANNLLTEETAKTLSVNALRELAGKVKGNAAPVGQGQFQANAENDNWKDFNPNAAIEAAMGGK
jgi:hypothetical protein